MDRQRVADLFEQAIDLPDSQRAAWVEAACGSDAALRIELERLLRADARAAAFMERPPALVSSVIDATTRSNETLPQFGPWRALRRIGAGGMGEVWLAERSDGEFEQQAAVKQLAWPTPGLLQRFRQERQILARLQHPDIAHLIDGGVDDRGAPYLVMEYVDGVPITQYVSEHALDLRARLLLFLRVCSAVQYAHRNLVVHRDLKPANIFIARELDQEVVKVLDFGVAKSRAFHGGQSLVTTPGTVLGTPCYMSPEQIRASGELDQHADLWGLAVIACECLTGRKPFIGKGFLAVALAVLEESKRPVPSQLGPAPAGFDAWFARATHLDRKRRFPSAREALDALLPICDASPGPGRRQPARNVSAPRAAEPSAPAPGSTLGRLSKYAVFAAAVGASVALWYRMIHQQNNPLAPQIAAAEALSVARTELAAAPQAVVQAEAPAPREAPPSVEPRAAAAAASSSAASTSEPRIVPLSGRKPPAKSDSRSARKPHPRAQSARVPPASAPSEPPAAERTSSDEPEQEPAGDGSDIRIDLTQ